MEGTIMQSLSSRIASYLETGEYEKQLSPDTVKAYRIDLTQFIGFVSAFQEPFSKESLTSYLALLHTQYQPKTTKRKIASLKAFMKIYWNTIPLTKFVFLTESPNASPKRFLQISSSFF